MRHPEPLAHNREVRVDRHQLSAVDPTPDVGGGSAGLGYLAGAHGGDDDALRG